MMFFLEFPIIGPLRTPLLLTEWIFTILSFELSLILLLKYKKQANQIKTYQEFGYSSLFFGLAFMRLLRIIGDFYSLELIELISFMGDKESFRLLLSNISDISALIGFLLFIFFMEKHKKYLFKKYLISIFSSIIFVIYIVFLFEAVETAKSIIVLIWSPIFFLVLFLHFVNLVRNIKIRLNFLIELLKFMTPFLLLFTGIIFSSEFVIEIFNLELRLIGSILQLISVGLICLFFITLPPLSEFDWLDKIEEIFIMNKTGACLFYKSFTDKKELLNEQIVTGAIASINIVLSELTERKDIGSIVIKKKGKIINIYSSDLLTGVLFSKEKLSYINFYLKQLIQKIETIYRNVLINWDGDLDIFQPVENIINETFLNK